MIKKTDYLFSLDSLFIWYLLHDRCIFYTGFYSNIFIFYLQICDFGLARVSEPDEDTTMTQEVVTQYYRSPEILMGATHYSYEIDIWSVGCIFAELMSRRILFQASTPLKQVSSQSADMRGEVRELLQSSVRYHLSLPLVYLLQTNIKHWSAINRLLSTTAVICSSVINHLFVTNHLWWLSTTC